MGFADDADVTELPLAEPKREPWEGQWTNLDGDDLARAPQPRDWLLKQGAAGLFPAGKCGLLVAPGGVGKTMALTQLALAIASGFDWLGREGGRQGYSVPKPGKVLLVLGEEDREEAQRRLYAAAQNRQAFALADAAETRVPEGQKQYAVPITRDEVFAEERRAEAAARITLLTLAGIPCSFIDRAADRSSEPTWSRFLDAFRTKLEREAGEEGWRAIIIDPLSRFAGLDAETDNACATRFVQAIESLTTVKGHPGIVVSHHTAKVARSDKDFGADAAAARGSSALVDGFRWVANLVRLGDGVVRFGVSKSNYGAHGEPIHLRWDTTKNVEGGALVRMTEDEAAAALGELGKRFVASVDGPKVLELLRSPMTPTTILDGLGKQRTPENKAALGSFLRDKLMAGELVHDDGKFGQPGATKPARASRKGPGGKDDDLKG